MDVCRSRFWHTGNQIQHVAESGGRQRLSLWLEGLGILGVTMRAVQPKLEYVVVERGISGNGEVVRTRRIAAFPTRNEAEECVRRLNGSPSEDDCYSIYSIETQSAIAG